MNDFTPKPSKPPRVGSPDVNGKEPAPVRTPVTTPEPMAHARLQTQSNNSWRDIALGSNDAAACDGMTRYARYNPAQDVAGNPIQDTVSTTIVYQLN